MNSIAELYGSFKFFVGVLSEAISSENLWIAEGTQLREPYKIQ